MSNSLLSCLPGSLGGGGVKNLDSWPWASPPSTYEDLPQYPRFFPDKDIPGLDTLQPSYYLDSDNFPLPRILTHEPLDEWLDTLRREDASSGPAVLPSPDCLDTPRLFFSRSLPPSVCSAAHPPREVTQSAPPPRFPAAWRSDVRCKSPTVCEPSGEPLREVVYSEDSVQQKRRKRTRRGRRGGKNRRRCPSAKEQLIDPLEPWGPLPNGGMVAPQGDATPFNMHRMLNIFAASGASEVEDSVRFSPPTIGVSADYFHQWLTMLPPRPQSAPDPPSIADRFNSGFTGQHCRNEAQRSVDCYELHS